MSRLVRCMLIGLVLTVLLGLGAFPLLQNLLQPFQSRGREAALAVPLPHARGSQERNTVARTETHVAAAGDRPFPAAEAAGHMTVPDGFKVTLFAGEPDVVQPIA